MYDESIMYTAATHNSVKSFKVLKELCPQLIVSTVTQGGKKFTPLDAAINLSHHKIIESIANKSDWPSTDAPLAHEHSLLDAATKGDKIAVQALIAVGADVNNVYTIDSRDVTILQMLCVPSNLLEMHCKKSIVKAIISAPKFNPNIICSDGNNYMHYLAFLGDIELSQMMHEKLKNTPDILNRPNTWGDTYLSMAVELGTYSAEDLRALIGMNLEIINTSGTTPLVFAKDNEDVATMHVCDHSAKDIEEFKHIFEHVDEKHSAMHTEEVETVCLGIKGLDI